MSEPTQPELYTKFTRGSVVQLALTENPKAKPYLGTVFRVIFADSTCVLAQPSIPAQGDPKPVLLIPFCETTAFDFIPPGFYKFGQLLPTTQVLDVNDDPDVINKELWSSLSEIFPQYNEQPAFSATPAMVPLAAPTAPIFATSVDRSREFRQGTVFSVTNSQHDGVLRYRGIVFQSCQPDTHGVLAIPEYGSGLTEAVYLPYAGTDFDFTPPGRRSFASGLVAQQRVYNPVTCQFVFVEDFYYDYWGLPFVLEPVLYCDYFMPVDVAYDPFYEDPFFMY
jgi:hypothetical protein